MKCKSITIGELKQGNKRMCLNPLRVFGRCDECPVMQQYFKGQSKNPCESAVINKERQIKQEKIKKIKMKIKELEKELGEIE